MYHLYVEKTDSYEPDLVGDFSELEQAQQKAKELKAKDPTILYTIEETDGSVNSYGELLSEVVERG